MSHIQYKKVGVILALSVLIVEFFRSLYLIFLWNIQKCQLLCNSTFIMSNFSKVLTFCSLVHLCRVSWTLKNAVWIILCWKCLILQHNLVNITCAININIVWLKKQTKHCHHLQHRKQFDFLTHENYVFNVSMHIHSKMIF